MIRLSISTEVEKWCKLSGRRIIFEIPENSKFTCIGYDVSSHFFNPVVNSKKA